MNKTNQIARVAYPAIVALSLMAAVSAHAQDESMNLAATGPSAVGLTRAEVQADLFKARADGSLKVWASNYSPVLVTTSERTRAEVRAEAIAANRSGYAARFYSEDSGSFAMSQQPAGTQPVPVFAKAGRVTR